MNKKTTIWQKLQEFFFLEEESKKHKKIIKLAYEHNPKKTRQASFYLLLSLFIVIIATIIANLIIEDNIEIFKKMSFLNQAFLSVFFAFSVACVYGLFLFIYLFYLEKIIIQEKMSNKNEHHENNLNRTNK